MSNSGYFHNGNDYTLTNEDKDRIVESINGNGEGSVIIYANNSSSRLLYFSYDMWQSPENYTYCFNTSLNDIKRTLSTEFQNLIFSYEINKSICTSAHWIGSYNIPISVTITWRIDTMYTE